VGIWLYSAKSSLLGTGPRVRITNNALCAAIALAVTIDVVRRSALSVNYLLSYYLTVALFYAESYNLVQQKNDEAIEKELGEGFHRRDRKKSCVESLSRCLAHFSKLSSSPRTRSSESGSGNMALRISDLPRVLERLL
jgi:hypothetical protein